MTRIEYFTLICTRESVSMGDDIDAPHLFEAKVSANMMLRDIFSLLSRRHYLANVAGRNHSWHAYVEDVLVTGFKGNKSVPEANDYLSLPLSHFAVDGSVRLHFKYNSAYD